MNRREFFRAGAICTALPGLRAAEALRREIRITGLETDRLGFPPRPVYSDAIHEFGPERGGVVLRLLTNAGITGWAYSSFGMIAGGPRVVETILQQELKPVLIGQDPAFPEAAAPKMWKALEYHGVQGVTQFAIAAVDIALWDILGKAAGPAGLQDARRLSRDACPSYNMCGWYYPNDAISRNTSAPSSDALEEGFRGVKIKVGRGTYRRGHAAHSRGAGDLRQGPAASWWMPTRRSTATRRCAAAACTSRWDASGTRSRCRRTTSDGYAELARELDIRIATGENEYTKYAFVDLIEARRGDVVQPDNRRAGGLHRVDGDRRHRRRLRRGSRQPRRRANQSPYAAGDAQRDLHGERQPQGRWLARREAEHGGWSGAGA